MLIEILIPSTIDELFSYIISLNSNNSKAGIVILFTDEDAEAQRLKVSCPRSHSQQVAEPGLELRHSDTKAFPHNR